MNNIKTIRKQIGLSQKDLAQKIGTTGQQVGHLESGRRKLTQDWIQLLVVALGCNPTDLLGKTDKNVTALKNVKIFS